MNENVVLSWDAKKVLSLKTPEELFTLGDKAPTLEDFLLRARKLVSHWHHKASESSDYTDVFTKTKSLEEAGRERLRLGVWGCTRYLNFEMEDRHIIIRHRNTETVVPGWGYRYETLMETYFVIDAENEDLVNNWILNLTVALHPANLVKPGSHQEFESQLTMFPDIHRGVKDQLLLSLDSNKKGKPMINLADVQRAKGPIPYKHVMWILSRLYNLTCFLQVQKVVNLNICPESCYIEPRMHDLVLLDGWQYTKELGQPAMAAPPRAVQICPELKVTKTPTVQTMLKMIKATGLELLGDIHGVNLLRDPKLPAALINWLLAPAGNDAIKEFSAYAAVRDSVAPRKFEEWPLQFNDVY